MVNKAHGNKNNAKVRAKIIKFAEFCEKKKEGDEASMEAYKGPSFPLTSELDELKVFIENIAESYRIISPTDTSTRQWLRDEIENGNRI